MRAIDTFCERMRSEYRDRLALFSQGQSLTYGELFASISEWRARLTNCGLGRGDVVAIEGDFCANGCALFFAAVLECLVIVPFYRKTRESPAAQNRLREAARVTHTVTLIGPSEWHLTERASALPASPLLTAFRERRHPGLIVFTSGSTGDPKAILHDLEHVLGKFVTPREPWRTLLFLLFDHFGGINTMLATFGSGGLAVCVDDRRPVAICQLIAETQAELLPTSPTFLNLLMTSGAYVTHDLSSLRLITYGTEVMSEVTLAKLKKHFPRTTLKQTYGLSEVGVLRSKSSANDSVWVKIGGDGFDVQVRQGVLWVRSASNMVGYLNAESPFDADGFMCTNDHVEIDGEYVKILGRKSDVINVGGQKVFPAEVESVLLEIDGVLEATVRGRKHPIMGQVAEAQIAVRSDVDVNLLIDRVRQHCVGRLERYKIPVAFRVREVSDMHSQRFKKDRRDNDGYQPQ